MAGARMFNGLNGTEVAAKILQEVEQGLSQDGRFARHLVYPLVRWEWRLSLEAYPQDTGAVVVKAGGEVTGPEVNTAGKMDLRGTVMRTAEPPQPDLLTARALSSAFGREGERPEPDPFARLARETGVRIVDPSAGAMRETELLSTNGRRPAPAVVAPVAGRSFVVDPNTGQRFELVAVNEKTETALIAPVSPSGGGRHVVMETGTGLPITGGAKPGPGPEAAAPFGGGSAVGSVQGPVERIEIGVSHPNLNEGGVGAPDAVRRSVGLPVPEPQHVKGAGIVDFPASSF